MEMDDDEAVCCRRAVLEPSAASPSPSTASPAVLVVVVHRFALGARLRSARAGAGMAVDAVRDGCGAVATATRTCSPCRPLFPRAVAGEVIKERFVMSRDQFLGRSLE